MHYDHDNDKEKKQDTNSVLLKGKNDRVPTFFYVKVYRWTGLLPNAILFFTFLSGIFALSDFLIVEKHFTVVENLI